MAVQPPELAGNGSAGSSGPTATVPARSGQIRGPSRSRRRGRRERTGRDIWIPGVILGLIMLACFLWPLVYRDLPSPTTGSLLHANLPPFSPGHLLGTDPLGNDIVSRLLHGGRVSLEVGLTSNLIGLVLGGSLGMFAAFKGGWLETLTMRLLDMLIAFPSLVLVLVVSTYLTPSKLNVIWAISFFSIPTFARLARAATLRLREQVYVVAARLAGQRDGAILVRHIAPNVLPQLLTYSLLWVAAAITIEASLSFLGFGVPASEPSWGMMISRGQAYISSNPELVLIPSACLFLTIVCLNTLGDALRARTGAP
jgi:peptide/nickel transport system permease protein